jgi:hypothetical protein
MKMNKKQLIAAWAMGIVFCLFYAYAVFMIPGPARAFRFLLPRAILILTMGFFFIYTLRDKKK